MSSPVQPPTQMGAKPEPINRPWTNEPQCALPSDAPSASSLLRVVSRKQAPGTRLQDQEVGLRGRNVAPSLSGDSGARSSRCPLLRVDDASGPPDPRGVAPLKAITRPTIAIAHLRRAEKLAPASNRKSKPGLRFPGLFSPRDLPLQDMATNTVGRVTCGALTSRRFEAICAVASRSRAGPMAVP